MASSALRMLCLVLLAIISSAAATKTTVVKVTSTTTVHVTATDYAGACDNFVGACVVYGSRGSAPYTTTVYRYAPTSSSPPSSSRVVTSTSTVLATATTTASNSGACSGFVGACVVYATGGDGSGTRTVYYAASSSGAPRAGNGQGYIGPKEDSGGNGYIGSAAVADKWTTGAVLAVVIVASVLVCLV